MFDKLSTVENRYEELMARVGTAEVQAAPSEFKTAGKALSTGITRALPPLPAPVSRSLWRNHRRGSPKRL